MSIYVVIFISMFLLWKIVLKPMVEESEKLLEKDSLEITERLNLIKAENILLRSKEIPTDEHIMKYYKMYCKKWEIDNKDMWITTQPLSYDEWEKRAKTPTKTHTGKGKYGLQILGGYQFIIPMTCDAMIGLPPNHIYHRYIDYESMINEKKERKDNG